MISTDTLTDNASPSKVAWTVIVIATVARLAVAAAFPLVPDETYYWEWSRHLSFGYFDHPPAIAWCIAAGRALLGDTPLGVRLVPVLCGTVAAVALMSAARSIYDGMAAVRVALLFAVLPLSAAGLVLATPDAPLMAAAAITVMAVVHAVDELATPAVAFRWWCVAGVAAGAGMESKLTGVLLPAFIACACVAIPSLRRVLRTPCPYAAVAIASIVVAPLLAWNSHHAWITFGYQLTHGLGTPTQLSGGAITKRLGNLAAGQLGLTAIILGMFMFGAVVRGVRGAFGFRAQMLALTAALCLALFTFSALRKPVEPNWPAIAYPAMIVLVAGMPLAPDARRWFDGGLAFAGALSVAIYLYATSVLPPVDVRGTRDPFSAAFGWEALADSVQAAQQSAAAASTGRQVLLAADRYQDASHIAFSGIGHPTVLSLDLAGRRNQYELWPRYPDVAHVGDGLVVALDDTPERHAVIMALEPHFESAMELERVDLMHGPLVVGSRRLWVLRGWDGKWPQLQ